MNLSIIVPIYNELENIRLLHTELTNVLQAMTVDYEILFVDDGSFDGSCEALKALADEDGHVRVVRFRRNYGQTAAMQAGFENATGDILVTLDGDLQNDPRDIPKLVQQLERGYDLAHGWRRVRHDAWLSRKLPSQLANRLISWTTRFPIHDLGCTLKAIRREIADDLELYGQMHRFIPILAHDRGARCIEVETNHRARQFGVSKYGLSRTLQVLLDLCTVLFLIRYFNNPMRLFGKLAALCGIGSMVAFGLTAMMKLTGGVDVTGNPLFMLSVFAGLTSTQLLSLGLLSELSARIYYQRDGHRPFTVAERHGFAKSAPSSDLRIHEHAA